MLANYFYFHFHFYAHSCPAALQVEQQSRGTEGGRGSGTLLTQFMEPFMTIQHFYFNHSGTGVT